MRFITRILGNIITFLSVGALCFTGLIFVSLYQFQKKTIESYQKESKVYLIIPTHNQMLKSSLIDYLSVNKNVGFYDEIDQDSAATILLGKSLSQINSLLEDNPLPETIVVFIKNRLDFQSFREEINVKFPELIFKSSETDISSLSNPISIGLDVLRIVFPFLLIISLMLIIFVNRITVSSKQREIKIMQMLGSRPFYILKKYLFPSLLTIASGIILGIIIYSTVNQILAKNHTDFAQFNLLSYSWIDILTFIGILGILLGISSFMVIKSTLKLKLEEIF